MAEIKLKRGKSTGKIPEKEDGSLLFYSDTGEVFMDNTNGERKKMGICSDNERNEIFNITSGNKKNTIGKGYKIVDKGIAAGKITIEGTLPTDIKDTHCYLINNSFYSYVLVSKRISDTECQLSDTSINWENDTDPHVIWFPESKTSGDTLVGYASHVEGRENRAYGEASHAEGRNTVASGKYSHTEGRETEAGYAAHAGGYKTKATGQASFTMGQSTRALGHNSFAGGYNTEASGMDAFVHGQDTVASGSNSAAFGIGNKASHSNVTVVGQYNAPSYSSKSLFEVGNGTDDYHRNTAFWVDSDGAAYLLKCRTDLQKGNGIITKDYLNYILEKVLKPSLVDYFLPVGTILYFYNTESDVEEGDPNVRYPGTTWEKIEDRFLFGANKTTLGRIAGEAAHTLTTAEMPSHAHKDGTAPQYDSSGNIQGINAPTNGGASAIVYWNEDSGRPTTYVGEGESHNNMPPYLAVWIWKRVK